MDFEKVLRTRKTSIDAKNLDRDTRNSYIYLLGNKNSLGIKPWSISELARAFDCNYLTAKKWVECGGNTKRKPRIRRNTKMTTKIKQFIVKEAGNKLTCSQGASAYAVASKIIKTFKEEYGTKEKEFKISHECVRLHMNKLLAKAQKIKKGFLLTPDNIKQRVSFCESIINNVIKFNEIFFTVEKTFSLNKFINAGTNRIRLTKGFKRRQLNGDPEIQKLVSSDMPKKSKNFMVAGGISYYGPGKLIFISGMVDTNAYSKILKYFKEDIDFINQKHQVNLLLQQDNARPHTASKQLIEELFYKKNEITEQKLKKPELIKKSKDMPKYKYDVVKATYNRRNDNYLDKLAELKKQIFNANLKQEELINKWPANSPVIIYYLLNFRI